MSGRFVRASKFRHVYGQPKKRDQYYDHIRLSKNAFDSNLVKVNCRYLSVNWEAGGGGAFAVIPLNETGKLPDIIPLFRGHTAGVIDTDWNPFHDNLLASASEDGTVLLWRVPEGFSTRADDVEDVTPSGKLLGHARKVGHVMYSPVAENILASSSADYTIKLWDVEREQDMLTLRHPDIIQSICFNGNGSLLVSTCRDKKVRVWDPRQEKAVSEAPGHAGAKNSRAVWLGELDRFATTGFGRMSDRQLGLWDASNLSNGPIGGFVQLDQSSGICMPFWDDSTKCLFLAGKGDGNIRYYEYTDDQFYPLSEFKSTDPTRGIAFMPKRGLDLQQNELMRAFRTVNDSYIEPLSFFVPRRVEAFQTDLFPPAPSGEPSLSAKDWLEGENAPPKLVDMEELYRERGGSTIARGISQPSVPTVKDAKEPKQNQSQSSDVKQHADVKAPALVSTGTSVKSNMDKFMTSVKTEDDDVAFEKAEKEKEKKDAEEWEDVSAYRHKIYDDSEVRAKHVDESPTKVEPLQEPSLPIKSEPDIEVAHAPVAAAEPSHTTPHTESLKAQLEKLSTEYAALRTTFEEKLQDWKNEHKNELESRDATIKKLEERIVALESSSVDAGKLRRLELEIEAVKAEALGDA